VRIAVCGVGLIGGSIGLAAKARLGAEVVGYDAVPEAVERAIKAGALDAGSASVKDAAAGSDIVFCAAPVARLPELVCGALEATGKETVVTDVGSTKRGLVAHVAQHPGARRFVGGHPIAGAETAGVENAREELFEGARWYLTPDERSGGLHYDRLQRAITGIGARPQAIDADVHDRLMATVSHLPHVIANVLVAQAETALSDDAERLPEVGRSFRDTTRVAGANPAIWADIFAANADAVADEIDAVVERLRDAASVIRAADTSAIDDWHRAARASRRRLIETGAGELDLRELRVGVDNRPGVVAEIALALGREGVNIEDMALSPAADMRTGAISLWIAGNDVERASALVRELGHTVGLVGAGE
jgi:prephenate dehydrogenase